MVEEQVSKINRAMATVFYRFFLETLQQHTGLSRPWSNNSITLEVSHI